MSVDGAPSGKVKAFSTGSVRNGRVRTETIYKICPASAWEGARAAGVFGGAGDDLADGYIHFSTADQLPGTLAKHFRGRDDLVLLAVRADALGDALKWEPSRGGALFPHLYGALDVRLVRMLGPLRPGPDGVPVPPAGLAIEP